MRVLFFIFINFKIVKQKTPAFPVTSLFFIELLESAEVTQILIVRTKMQRLVRHLLTDI